MLDPKARIAARRIALQLLIDTEYAIDGAFAIGMRGKLKSGLPGFAQRIESFRLPFQSAKRASRVIENRGFIGAQGYG